MGPATVGDGFLDALPRNRRLVLNLRERPEVVGLKSAGGVVIGCSGFGRGCDQSFALRISGNVSSRILRFSSMSRLTSSLIACNSASAAIIRLSLNRIESMILVMSSCVALFSFAVSSAATEN